MKYIYVKVEGITCDHCIKKITKEIKKINNIINIQFDKNIIEIEYKRKIDKKQLIESINNIDYYTNLNMISEDKKSLKKTMSILDLFKIALIIVIFIYIINKIFGYNIFNTIPIINTNTTYIMLFVMGLLTSIHCISMCGAINLLASTSMSKNYKKPVLYNLGRLISYTFIGGIIGLVGSVLTINSNLQGVFIIFSSILMIMMAFNMMGIINFKIKLPKIFINKTNNSFIIGLLNGLMPCGPLQTMQVYALVTGSFFYGALSMFLFCLGTIPLMLFMGMFSNLLNRKYKNILNKISITLIILLSLVMFNRGLLTMGFDFNNIFKTNYDNYIQSELVDEYQVVEFNLSYSGYKDIVVQKGISVKMIINATSSTLSGCNNGILINEFGITKKLKIGENIIIFTPEKVGTFTYTCWMGMIKNTIKVVDDSNFFN
ncbi:MAG: sulfite exporter TauE/SafE family protein [Bacilli bacterium]